MQLDDKFYYTIGEVAEILNTSTSQLRYWSGEFSLNVRKNRKGDRLFQKEDLEKLKQIQRLLKDEGYTIDGAKKRLKEQKKNGTIEKNMEVNIEDHHSIENPINPDSKSLQMKNDVEQVIRRLESVKLKMKLLKIELD